MTLNKVTVTCDITDGQGNPVLGGTGYWNPSVQVSDATDHMLIAPGVSIPVAFKSTGSPSVTLIADDNSATLPAGWRWVFTPPAGTGLASCTYDISYSNGSTQYLSALTPVSTAVSTFPLNPMTTAGDMITGGSSPAGIPERLGAGSGGQVLTVDSGTGLPAWKDASAASLPLTTLGDTVYEDATPAPARLAGNTTSTKKFYTQTGTGSASAAPAWGTIAAADVLQPWQFLAESYGAKGDCKVIPDGAMASTSSGVLTSASGLFTAGDAGKAILVAGAGNAAGRTTLVTTIASYQSATQVTLTANPAAAVTDAWCVWGTDDTDAVNSAVSAAYAYWQGNSCRQPEILMPSIYMIAGAPTQGGATKGNAQIPLPVPPLSGPKFQPRFTGAPGSPTAMYGVNSTPLLTSGTLVCGRTDGTLDATYGPASVVGTWTYQQGARDGAMANLRPVFDGVSVVVPYASTYTAFDLYGATGADLYVSVAGWATPAQMGNPNAGDFIGKTWAVGVRTPTQANDGDIKIRNIAAAGVYAGLQIGEHVQVDSGTIFYCYHGVHGYSDGTGSSASHASHISYICVEACYYQLAFLESCKLDIDSLDIDGGAGGSGYLIYDPSDAGRGQVTVRGLGATEGRPSVSGGALMRIINGDQVPGTAGISQPAVPASGTALKNDFYRDALVCIAGGTVTGIAVADSGGGNSLTLGITGGPVVIASGKQVTLTYSDAPTWTWTLL